MLQGCVAVDQRGMLGAWNGFGWIEKRPRPGWDITKISYAPVRIHKSPAFITVLNNFSVRPFYRITGCGR